MSWSSFDLGTLSADGQVPDVEPSLHQLIATAILPCENLEIPSTSINVSGRCHDTLTKMGLPAFHKIVGVSSWQQLSYDEEMEIVR